MSNEKTIDALSHLLADSYTLYLKTHNYHWNVTGPMFNTLHVLFEQQYNELALAVDEIAERIRILGGHAPGSYSAFAKMATIKEENGAPDAMEMIKTLGEDQLKLVETAKKVLEVAEANNDDPSVDLSVRRQDVHQKNHWMLSAHLE